LNAKAAREELFATGISFIISPVSISFAAIFQSFTSRGDGKYSTAASITICTQIFCKAEPQTTAYNSLLQTAFLKTFFNSSTLNSCQSKYFSIKASSKPAIFSIICSLNS
jgi:hypothetical protein